MKITALVVLLALSACSAAPDAAPPASNQGLQDTISPTGGSGMPMGTSNTIYGGTR